MDFSNKTFIERYGELVGDALTDADRRIRNARVRVNVSKMRMIKAGIQPDFEATPETMTKEQLDFRKNSVEHAEVINRRHDIHIYAPKYLTFLLDPKNDYVRHEIDQDYTEWTCLEDVIYKVNSVLLDKQLENIVYDCNCDASDNDLDTRHIYMDGSGFCSRGSKMTLVDKDMLLNKLDFISKGNLDVLKLEVF
jgi:hypothetical protein